MTKGRIKNNKSDFQKVLVAVCVLCSAVILFAFLWNRFGQGMSGHADSDIYGEDGKAFWHEIWKPEISDNGVLHGISIHEPAVHNQAGLEGLENLSKEVADRAETAYIDAETENFLDLDKYLMIVDETRPITQEWIDENIEVIDVVNDRGQEKKIERRTWYYFRQLKKYLEEEEGIIIVLDYGYRSLQDQQDIIDKMTEEHGAEYAWYYAAEPGTSEHHTGLGVDVCLIVDGEVIDENVAMNAQTEIFGIIHAVMPDYGFILDFPYESWHMRFVGSPEIAKAYYASGMSFKAFADWYRQNS